MGLQQVNPTAAAVTLDEAKAHLRIDGDSDDADLSRFIVAATDYIEQETRTSLLAQQFVQTFDAFPAGRVIQLLRPPLASVEAVKYLDADGTEQTLSDELYRVDIVSRPGRIVLSFGASWPATASEANAVRVEFTAGHGNVSQVPPLLKQAVLLMVGHMFENREAAIDRRIDTVPLAVESIVRLFEFPEAV